MKSECNFSFIQIKQKIEAYCAYQDRCRFDIENKLASWGIPENKKEIITDLISNRFLDEERFARSYASGKFRIKQWGKVKIKQHLKAKFVSTDLIQKAINEIDAEEYYTTIERLAQKKSLELKSEQDSWKKKSKIMRFLASKGYEQDLIYSVMSDLTSE